MFNIIDFSINAVKSVPTENITGRITSSAAETTDLSIIGLLLQADIVVKIVLLLLVISSVWSWAIIFEKWVTLKSIRAKTQSFEKVFWSGQPLENLYEKIKGREHHPVAMVFSSAMREWQNRNIRDIASNHQIKAGVKERIYQAMHVAINKSLSKIEKNLSFLATVGSSAPFIGLFGTVWGIMISFQSIAIAKNTTLAVVAPGIAEALLATAFGLVAAIPAVIFYNKFATDVNRLANNLDDFSNELGAIMSKELDALK